MFRETIKCEESDDHQLKHDPIDSLPDCKKIAYESEWQQEASIPYIELFKFPTKILTGIIFQYLNREVINDALISAQADPQLREVVVLDDFHILMKICETTPVADEKWILKKCNTIIAEQSKEPIIKTLKKEFNICAMMIRGVIAQKIIESLQTNKQAIPLDFALYILFLIKSKNIENILAQLISCTAQQPGRISETTVCHLEKFLLLNKSYPNFNNQTFSDALKKNPNLFFKPRPDVSKATAKKQVEEFVQDTYNPELEKLKEDLRTNFYRPFWI